MQFILYTEKTVSQCLKDLNERLHAKATKTSPDLGGWVDKDGSFSLTVTAPVLKRFRRTTRLTANIRRDKNITVIDGYVSGGMSPSVMQTIGIVLALICAYIAFQGELMFALMLLIGAFITYIPLYGDYVNSDVLLVIVEKTLKADPKRPKK
jgi:hypothetical protein